MATLKDWRQLSLQPFEGIDANEKSAFLEFPAATYWPIYAAQAFCTRLPHNENNPPSTSPPPPRASFRSLWNLSDENLGPEKVISRLALIRKIRRLCRLNYFLGKNVFSFGQNEP